MDEEAIQAESGRVGCVKDALFDLFIEKGILDIRLKPGRVEVQYDPKRTSPEVLLALLRRLKLKPTLVLPGDSPRKPL